MKEWIPNWFLLFLLTCMVLLAKDRNIAIPGLICALLLYLFKIKNRSFLIAAMILIVFSLPRECKAWNGNQGTVIEVKKSYVILEQDSAKILLYTKDKPVYDSLISFEGELQEISKDLGFYTFDFEEYYERKGITQCVYADSVMTLKESSSLRGAIQKRIESFDTEEKELLYQVLFGIQSESDYFFTDVRLSYAGILYLLETVLKKRCYRRQRKRMVLGCTLLLSIVSHGRYLFVQRLIYGILEETKLSKRNAFSISFLIGLFFYPHVLFSASFLFPCIFRLSLFLAEDRKGFSYFFSLLLESILYQSIHPLRVFFFRYLTVVQGILILIGLIEVSIKLPLLSFFGWYFYLSKSLDSIALPGTVLGIGCVFFVMILLPIHKQKYFFRYAGIALILFLWLGLFHPLGEITYINVGQGDSILIRMPFNRENILIDTGKPSAYTHLTTYLNAKGIRTIDILFVTHGDTDHAGNVESLKKDYKVKQVVDTHFETIDSKYFTFFDLNKIENEDENQSSLVLYTKINDLIYLFMGDADEITEKEMIQNYGNLKADLLKLSHHGSQSGSSARFLDTIRPSLSIISAGSYSLYHHPATEVMERLNKRHIRYVNTHDEGDIRILQIFGFNVFSTSTGKIGIIPS